MSRRERLSLVLGVIVAIFLVAYPLAYRISSERQADTVRVGTSVAPVAPATSIAPTPIRTVARPSITPKPPSPPPREPEEPPSDSPWAAVATEHRGAIGKAFVYVCPPDGTFQVVWGTDTYTDDSSVCTAAVHKGVITRERGGTVTIIIRKALKEYTGTTRNGVTTDPYGAWDGSFQVVAP